MHSDYEKQLNLSLRGDRVLEISTPLADMFTSEYEVRDVLAEDLESIREIYNHEVLFSDVTLDLEIRTSEQMLNWYELHKPPYLACVACYEDQVVGFAALSPLFSRAGYQEMCEVSVYVDKDHRRSGIGNQLIGYLLSHAKLQPLHTIVAVVSRSNIASAILLIKHGFVNTGVIREAGLKFGRRISIELYQYFINDV